MRFCRLGDVFYLLRHPVVNRFGLLLLQLAGVVRLAIISGGDA